MYNINLSIMIMRHCELIEIDKEFTTTWYTLQFVDTEILVIVIL